MATVVRKPGVDRLWGKSPVCPEALRAMAAARGQVNCTYRCTSSPDGTFLLHLVYNPEAHDAGDIILKLAALDATGWQMLTECLLLKHVRCVALHFKPFVRVLVALGRTFASTPRTPPTEDLHALCAQMYEVDDTALLYLLDADVKSAQHSTELWPHVVQCTRACPDLSVEQLLARTCGGDSAAMDNVAWSYQYVAAPLLQVGPFVWKNYPVCLLAVQSVSLTGDMAVTWRYPPQPCHAEHATKCSLVAEAHAWTMLRLMLTSDHTASTAAYFAEKDRIDIDVVPEPGDRPLQALATAGVSGVGVATGAPAHASTSPCTPHP